eukprot:Colp12_sorted_trinity150504_noHs@28471
MYTGMCDLEKNTGRLLQAAQFFEIDPLRNLCKYRLMDDLNANNLAEIAELAAIHQVEELLSQCIQMLKTQLVDDFLNPEFLKQASTHPEFLALFMNYYRNYCSGNDMTV